MSEKSFVNWQFSSENVQSNVVNGEFVSSESTLILGGPSRLSMLATGRDSIAAQTSMFPIGLIDNVTISQNRGVQRFFEIGSKRAYFVPGRLMSGLNLGRTLFFGPSLLRMMYAVAPYGANGLGYGRPFKVNGNDVQAPPEYANLFGPEGQRQLVAAPGFGQPSASSEDNRDFFINLASDLFNIPVGLCVILKDPKNNPYGAMYLEDVYIESHTLNINSANIIMAESISAQFSQVAPVQLVASV